MRRSRSRSRVLHSTARTIVALATAVGAALVPVPARAQDVAKEGALFLLLPIGARAVGQGQAVVASRLGADGIWWNPAALAWLTRREVAVDHAKNFFVTGDAIEAVFPAGRAGVLSASLLYFNFGDQAATDPFGSTIGTLYSRAVVLATSYAATFGDRVSAGLTYKLVRQTQSCGGSCPATDTYSVQASAFDVGMHAVAGNSGDLTLGVMVRNVGFGLQIIDTEQADPLPMRIHIGADYRVAAVTRATPGATLHLTAEVVGRASFATPRLRAGAEFGYAETLFLRGGVVKGSGDGANAAVGFGIRKGTLGLEFARTFGGLSADAGDPPTYLTLRLAFR